MQLRQIVLIALSVVLFMGGCPLAGVDRNGEQPFNLVAGITATGHTASGEPSEAATATRDVTISGALDGEDYRLFDLGAGRAGERWLVSDVARGLGSGSFLVVLLDEEFNLLRRQIVYRDTTLEHVLRADASKLYLGVAPSYGNRAADFRFSVRSHPGYDIPTPRRQVVWLNFAGADNVDVHARKGLAFARFDAARLGSNYAGATETVKAAIVEAMREDYAAYNVTILTSDDGPPPSGAYATLHFGGWDDRLLGLADSVDQYNVDPWQTAVIFVESFADFSGMGLSDEEMGQMIGNVASHEFGHLLGLFHTRLPQDVMDTTGTAWDLAADQSFLRGPLESSVFPVGYEDSPQRLAETVGYNPAPRTPAADKQISSAKMNRKLALRALVRDELRHRCGNCLNPDE